MLSDFRSWLAAELKLLGNASHHAYSFGQANMAKRALERLDSEVGERISLLLERPAAQDILRELALLDQSDGTQPPALAGLRDALRTALAAPAPPPPARAPDGTA